ncbi:MAG: Hsp20/alpha crystallin family protein [Chloroflexota bacterium]
MATNVPAPAAPTTKPAARTPATIFDMVEEQMGRLWDQGWPLAGWPLMRRGAATTEMGPAWMPRMDILEKDRELQYKVELPGLKKEEIQVTVDEGDLVIQGERTTEADTKEGDYRRVERSYGRFYRRSSLPANANADKIRASYKDGLLDVRVPLEGEPKPAPKKVSIG